MMFPNEGDDALAQNLAVDGRIDSVVGGNKEETRAAFDRDCEMVSESIVFLGHTLDREDQESRCGLIWTQSPDESR